MLNSASKVQGSPIGAALWLAGALVLAGCGEGGGTTGSGGGSSSSTSGSASASTSASSASGSSSASGGSSFASPAEQELADLINKYRGDSGLPAVPLSRSLTLVAQTHCHDLIDNNPDVGSCNLHSWSDKGSWTPCCYTPDHAQAQCMWDKPSELTNYPGAGYEISMTSGSSVTPEAALNAWKGSPGHNDVILNKGIWASSPWKAVGVGIVGGHANVWFGKVEDPAQ